MMPTKCQPILSPAKLAGGIVFKKDKAFISTEQSYPLRIPNMASSSRPEFSLNTVGPGPDSLTTDPSTEY